MSTLARLGWDHLLRGPLMLVSLPPALEQGLTLRLHVVWLGTSWERPCNVIILLLGCVLRGDT